MNNKPIATAWIILLQMILVVLFTSMNTSHAEQVTTTVLQSKSKKIQIALHTPRYFGYTAGDTIQHMIDISMPSGSDINTHHIPAKGAISDWLDVIDVQLHKQSSTQSTLRIQYQVAKSVKTTELLEIPAFKISLGQQPEVDSITVPAWTFSYSTIVPSRMSDAEITPQPAQQPVLLTTQPMFGKMLIYLFAATTCLGYLLWRRGYWRFQAKKTLPFYQALLQLKHIPEQSSTTEQIEQAFRFVHNAFNQTAGESVFESQLDRFYAAHPQFASLQAETETFFKQSRQLFYESGASADQPNNHPLKMLKQLCVHYDRLQRQR